MLVLTRRTDESVDLYIKDGDGETRKVGITILRSRGTVRLGFDADPSVHIVRREVEHDAAKALGADR